MTTILTARNKWIDENITFNRGPIEYKKVMDGVEHQEDNLAKAKMEAAQAELHISDDWHIRHELARLRAGLGNPGGVRQIGRAALTSLFVAADRAKETS